MLTSPGALPGLVRAGAALLVARAEFASVELALVRAQFVRWLLLATLALLLGLLGLLSATAVVSLVLWPLLGWGALLVPAVGYLAAATWVVVKLQREVDAAPPLLHETLQEIARDRDALLQAVAPRDGNSAEPSRHLTGDGQ
ncbi:MAG: phage holin family protein [Burkholderiales bacterium]|jgi:uncharacterized membrane protein YqjE|nr:phage holin family protein [Burkholderiales bacterium]